MGAEAAPPETPIEGAVGPSGGPGGRGMWSMPIIHTDDFAIAYLEARYGVNVDSISQTFPDGTGFHAGGPGGPNRNSLNYETNFYLVEVSGKYGQYIDSIDLVWRFGDVELRGHLGVDPGQGHYPQKSYYYPAPPGYYISSLWGWQGDYIDSLGVIFTPMKPAG